MAHGLWTNQHSELSYFTGPVVAAISALAGFGINSYLLLRGRTVVPEGMPLPFPWAQAELAKVKEVRCVTSTLVWYAFLMAGGASSFRSYTPEKYCHVD